MITPIIALICGVIFPLQFDIPEWLVDMRHSIVHGALPSYHLLHQALHFIKDYLVVCQIYFPRQILILKTLLQE